MVIYHRIRTCLVTVSIVAVLIGISLTIISNSGNIEEKEISIVKVIECQYGVPCEYDDIADIRILILTHKRYESLQKLLTSLNELEMDGDTAALEIWIDRNETDHVSSEIVTLIREFRFKHGRVRVHVQDKHAGIIGQWIDTWRPKLRPKNVSSSSITSFFSSDELVLYLEDDMSVSPHAYRWLKAAHRYYANRTDLAGLTLQSDDFIVAQSGRKWIPPSRSLTFLYVVSTWGFAPRASVWRDFQDWFKEKVRDDEFRPYVNGIISTSWYKIFERKGTADTMWSMWFIYYCHHRKLYTLYSNIRGYENKNNTCLSVNRLEPGLHYHGKGINNTALLLRSWKDEYTKFTNNIPIYQFNGKEAYKI